MTMMQKSISIPKENNIVYQKHRIENIDSNRYRIRKPALPKISTLSIRLTSTESRSKIS